MTLPCFAHVQSELMISGCGKGTYRSKLKMHKEACLTLKLQSMIDLKHSEGMCVGYVMVVCVGCVMVVCVGCVMVVCGLCDGCVCGLCDGYVCGLRDGCVCGLRDGCVWVM